jgi:O-methyltransferase
MFSKFINKVKFHLKAFFSDKVFEADGLYTIHNSGFMNQDSFKLAYKAGCETNSWGQDPHIEWRVHVVLWAARNALNIKGDFVECGVYKGGFCNSIFNYLDFASSGKKYWLFDSYKFQFYTKNSSKEEVDYLNKKYKNYINISYLDEVKKRFTNKPVEIVEGLVPVALNKFTGTQVSFLSIDMNSTEAEIGALEFFWDKLSIGAVVVLDDYAQYAHSNQYHAINDYCVAKGINVLSLPTGQGLILKV